MKQYAIMHDKIFSFRYGATFSKIDKEYETDFKFQGKFLV